MDIIHSFVDGGILKPLSALTLPSRIAIGIAVVILLGNFKNLPFIYHASQPGQIHIETERNLGLIVLQVRCFNGFIKHMYRTPHNWKKDGRGPSALFQPMVTSSHSPAMECDYNMHKSSSTYFTDLDVSRLHLLPLLLNEGIKTLSKKSITGPNGDQIRGGVLFVLGGLECNFRREIKPYEKYEIWTRVLAWDRKWLYIVSHFVKKGAVKPRGYTLQGRTAGGKKRETKAKSENGSAKALNKVIFASAISKYVFKKGRFTLNPELVLEASGLLPSRPGGWATPSGPAPAVDGHEVTPDDLSFAGATEDEEWTWQKVEMENSRGLRLASNFTSLDGLDNVFTGSERNVLGVYSEYI